LTGSLWICPGASDLMQSYRNTYKHALGIPGTSGRRGAIERENVFWVWDNVENTPYFTGVRRGSGDPNPLIPITRRIYPHQYKVRSKRGAINILFADGHVGAAVYLTDPFTPAIILRGE